jgi:hypothetical protein
VSRSRSALANRRRVTRRLAFIASLATFLGAVSLPAEAATSGSGGSPAAPASAPEQPDHPELTQAFTRARQTGQRVELPDGLTEYNTRYADPSGTTTLVMSPVPVRVRRGSGWTGVDPTLVKRDDGSLAPKAALLDVVLSGGGSGPLARVRREGQSVNLSAPVALPTPVVSGATATYPEVFGGVDLLVTVTAESFSEVLVVKNRAAAAEPGLRRLRFGLSGSGVHGARTTEGGLRVTGANGVPLLLAARPTMWDSGSTAKAVGGAASASGAASADGPAESSHQAPLGLSASDSDVTVTPPESLLSDAATSFPVFIDPTLGSGTATQWAMVDVSFPTTSYYKWANGSSGEGMGHISTAVDGTHTKRLFFGYDTSSLRVTGRTIVSSTLRTHEVWAYSCNTNGMEAWLTNPISGSTTWNSQAANGYWVGPSTVRNVATSGRPDCAPSGTEIDFDTQNQVIASVLKGWATTTIGLKASNEGANSGWRRFTNNTTLKVVYNTYPNTPSSPQMVNPPVLCGGSVPAGDMPDMRVKVTDPDGGLLKTRFEIWKGGASSPSWTFTTPTPSQSGTTVSKPMPALATGSWSWIARAEDDGTPSLASGYTQWCNFTVDNTAPSPPSIWFDSGTFAVGQDVHFHFTGGASDVTQYRWAVNSDAPTFGPVSVYDGTATVHLTTFGPFYLSAWAYDAAGNRSTAAVWGEGILVAGADARDWWRFDEGSTSGTANQRSPGNGLNLTGGVSMVPGYPLLTGYAAQLNGTNASGAGLGQGGPADGGNFSAGAWGKLTAGNTSPTRQVLLSQDAGAYSSFTIAVETTAGPIDPATNQPGPVLPRYVGTLFTSTGAVAMRVVSKRPLRDDEWSHATIEVERLQNGALQLSLFTKVVGDSEETADSMVSTASTSVYATSASNTAYVRVGAETRSYAGASYWNGAVDEAVTAKGIFDAAQRDGWRFPAS